LRWSNWATVQQTNRMIAEFVSGQERAQFIDVTPPMLDAHGKVRGDLFRWDGLHLNARGYALWTSIIRPIILERFPVEKTAGIVQDVKPGEEQRMRTP
jgi:lysophospholipase L1-like esterase